MTPFFHPHPSPLPSRERKIVLPGKYGGRELEGGGELTLTQPPPSRARNFTG